MVPVRHADTGFREAFLWLLEHSKNLTVIYTGNVVVRLVGERTELL